MAIGTELCQYWGVPGFSLVTLDDLRLRRDTPSDTFENLNLEGDRAAACRRWPNCLTKAWDDPKFKGPVELKWQRTTFTRPGRFALAVVAGAEPSARRVHGDLVPHVEQRDKMPSDPLDALCDGRPPNGESCRAMPRATGCSRGCRGPGDWSWKNVNVQVYQVEPGTGAITAATRPGPADGGHDAYV